MSSTNPYTERIDTLSAQLQQTNRDYAEAEARQDYLAMANIRETQTDLVRQMHDVKLQQQRDQAQAVKDRIDVLRVRREGGGA